MGQAQPCAGTPTACLRLQNQEFRQLNTMIYLKKKKNHLVNLLHDINLVGI